MTLPCFIKFPDFFSVFFFCASHDDYFSVFFFCASHDDYFSIFYFCASHDDYFSVFFFCTSHEAYRQYKDSRIRLTKTTRSNIIGKERFLKGRSDHALQFVSGFRILL